MRAVFKMTPDEPERHTPKYDEGHVLSTRKTIDVVTRLFATLKYWRRGWDSNPTALFRFCNLQIQHCQSCRECQRCRGALHAVARTAELAFRKAAGGRSDLALVALCTATAIPTGMAIVRAFGDQNRRRVRANASTIERD